MRQTAELQAGEPLCLASIVEAAETRVIEVLALMTAIEAGELLADAPSAPDARRRHAAGISVLAVMTRELCALRSELGAGLPGV